METAADATLANLRIVSPRAANGMLRDTHSQAKETFEATNFRSLTVQTTHIHKS